MMAQGAYDIPGDRLRRRGGAHQHHTDGRLPRRRTARGRGAPRADDGPGRRGAGPGPRRDPPPQPARTGRFPFRTLSGVTYDVGDYDRPLREALRDRRLRPAARASRPPGGRRGDRVQLGIGVSVVRRDHRGRRRQEFGSVDRARRRHRHHRGGDVRRTARATRRRSRCSSPTGSGSRWRRSRSSSPTPRSCRAAGAPADRVRCSSAAVPCTRRPGRCSSRRASGAAGAARGGRRRHRAHRRRRVRRARRAGARRVTWVAGRPAGDGRVAAEASTRRQDGPTFPFGAHVAVVEVDTETGRVDPGAPRRRRRLRPHPQPAAGHRPAARRPGARASRRRCTRRSGYDADGQPAHRHAGRLPPSPAPQT